MLTLTPGAGLARRARARSGARARPSRLDPATAPGIARAAARIGAIAAGAAPVYGVNTGFGKLASIRIDAGDVATLQRNLILSHCCGVGEPLPPAVVRLVLALKLASLGRGASGVQPATVALHRGDARPRRPAGHPRAGLGRRLGRSRAARPHGRRHDRRGRGDPSTASACPPPRRSRRAGLAPIVLAAKEGLALINGTQVSTALALRGLFGAHRCLQAALVTGALSTDAAMGSSAPFHPEIHALRGHRGQIDAAAALARPARRLGDPREPPRRRQPGAGSLLHPLPAAGGRRRPST